MDGSKSVHVDILPHTQHRHEVQYLKLKNIDHPSSIITHLILILYPSQSSREREFTPQKACKIC